MSDPDGKADHSIPSQQVKPTGGLNSPISTALVAL